MAVFLTKRGDAQLCPSMGCRAFNLKFCYWLIVSFNRLLRHFRCFFIGIIGYLLSPNVTMAIDVEAHFNSLTIADGLSQSSVYAITQDQAGFLWFATEDGLNRYDGYGFKIYFPSSDGRGLASTNTRVLMLAADGRIWVGTEETGISVFSPEVEQFVSYSQKDGRSRLSSDSIAAIVQDSKGSIWVGTEGGGLNLFDHQTQTFTHFMAEFDIIDIAEDSNGILWLASKQGLIQFNPKNQQWRQFQPQPDDNTSISHVSVTSLAIVDDVLWAGTVHGLNKMSLVTPGQFKRYYADVVAHESISHNNITDLLIDSKQQLWITTFGGGVNRLGHDQVFVHFRHRLNQGNSLADDVALALYEDNQGSIWIGTFAAGVNQLAAQQQGFEHIHYQANVANSLSNNIVRSIFKDSQQRLWIGTHDGINVMDENQGKGSGFRLFKNEANNGVERVSERHLISIVEDQQGIIWMGTGIGVDRYDPKTDQLKHYFNQQDNANSLSNDFVRQLLYDSQHRVWLGTENGLNLYHPETDSFERFLHDPQNPSSISNNSIRALYEDDKGYIWVGTRTGLNRLDVNTMKFKHYFSDDQASSISHNFVTSMYQDANGELWLATYGGGLNRYDYTTDTFSHYDTDDGLSNNNLYSVLGDNQGHIWLSSNSGLSRFNPQTERFRHYQEKDGLQSNEFNYNAQFKAADGEIFFGGVNGFNRFYPDNFKDDTIAPNVVISDFLLGNQILPVGNNLDNEDFVLSKAIDYLDSIQLTYRQNFISFDFVALHFADPMNNQYAYQLEGQDTDWVMTDSMHRRATYTNLDYGEYVFRVKASNHNGYWQERERQLKLTVLPPPWQTWWAYLAYCVLLGAPLFVYLYSQRRILRYNLVLNERLERKVKERTAALEIKNKEIIETQQQLVQSEKMASLGTLTAGVAHEINNPNNFVSLSTDMLSQEVDSVKQYIIDLAGADAEQELLESFEQKFTSLNYHLKTIKDGSERIKMIVEGLRTFTQLDAAAKKVVPVTDLIQSTVDLVKAQYKKIIEFDLVFTVAPEIECYPASLNQVFMNIIVNACHAIEGSEGEERSVKSGNVFLGSITIDCVWCDETQSTVNIIIEDTGHGMTQETKSKLFEPFYTTKPVGQGTGLGLSISYGIIQQHQGELTVESELGKGSKFILTIPVRM